MTEGSPFTLDERYRNMGEEEALAAIGACRRRLGERVVILGHHYQRDSVVRFADFLGDSLRLSQLAAGQSGARWIVFCGVHFMAESADILRQPGQTVLLPNPSAGCSMAEMVSLPDLWACRDALARELGGRTVPVAYVNSSAEVKAFTGEAGGATCTSSNAGRILRWAFSRGDRVLFVPDRHLGGNAGAAEGLSADDMALWDPAEPPRGQALAGLRRARLILWKGHCAVHQMFKVSHVQHFRNTEPDRRVIVHPECAAEVVHAADEAGSTEQILQRVEETAPATRWAVGTEINMVNRLAARFAPGVVEPLTRFGTRCPTMFRIDPRHLLSALEDAEAGRERCAVRVDEEVAAPARLALQRMLDLS